MTIQVTLPDRLAEQARELAAREHTTVDALVASTLTAQLNHTPQRPTIAERAARVNWEKVDAIPARVPDAAPALGDERSATSAEEVPQKGRGSEDEEYA
jgi:hypothetical protein